MEFLWRFSHLDDAGRGRDPHVRRATPREADIAQRELDEWKPKDERPAIVFTIKGEDGKDRYFIGWSTISEGYSMTGRCTKAYPVYEEATNQKAFLKDAWRAHNLSPEAEILRELRDAKVEHIPIYMCGGDVEGSVTQTDLYITVEEANNWGVNSAKRDGSWKRGRSWDMVTQRFQHRFVSDVIAKPLDKVENSKHMMLVFSQAFTAHRQAYERCEIIHRDISDNNIMITASGGGILNDWDMAKKKKI
ncbi:hypothetical protein H0H93_014878 [Arthromyces matolae]|nr:hypothetical protein H0H93_014878 [Arthromyces matolae]